MSDTTEWQNKWNRDFSDALEAIISLVIGAVVAALAAFFGVAGTPVIIIGIGIALLITGIISTVKYFNLEPVSAAKSKLLLKGLISFLVGYFCRRLLCAVLICLEHVALCKVVECILVVGVNLQSLLVPYNSLCLVITLLCDVTLYIYEQGVVGI